MRLNHGLAAWGAAVIFLAVFADLEAVDDTAENANAATKSAARLEEQVAQLIAALDAPARATRTAAERRLLELGPDVLPHLPPMELVASFTVRETLQKTRFELERRKARQSVRASLVSLAGTHSFTERLAELSRQSSNRLNGSRLPATIRERSVTIDVADAPFWPVLDRVASEAGVKYRFDSRSGGMEFTLGDSQTNALPIAVAYDAAFRIVAGDAQSREHFGAPNERLWRIPLMVTAEPRLRPLFLQYAAAEVTARTDDKRSLAPLNPGARYELALGEEGGEARIQLDFRVAAEKKSHSLDLEGKLLATVAAGTELIRFSHVSQLAGRRNLEIALRRGGVTVTLGQVTSRKGAGGVQELRVNVDVIYDAGGPAFESHRAWLLHNEVFLEESGKQRIPLNGGYATTAQREDGVGLEYRFTGLPDPLPEYAFVYVAPTLIVDVPVRFEIKGVRLNTTESRVN